MGLGVWSVVSPPDLPDEWTDWFVPREGSQEIARPTEDPDPGQTNADLADVSFPGFDVVRVTRGGTGVIAGRAAPSATVEIFANGKLLGRAEADRRGEWVLIFDDPLPAGGSELSMTSRLPGEVEVESSDIVVVVVPEQESGGFVPGEDEGVLAIRTPRDGEGQSTILQKPAGADFGGGLGVSTIDYDENGRAILSGQATARSDVRIYLNNEFLDAVTADDNGSWTSRPDRQIPEGENLLRLDQVITEDEVELRIEVPFDRSQPLDMERAEGSIVVRPGNNLWQISRRLYGTGFRYTMIFSANRDHIRDPDLIYPGQVFNLPKQSQPDTRQSD